jgi:hypothetical protein
VISVGGASGPSFLFHIDPSMRYVTQGLSGIILMGVMVNHAFGNVYTTDRRGHTLTQKLDSNVVYDQLDGALRACDHSSECTGPRAPSPAFVLNSTAAKLRAFTVLRNRTVESTINQFHIGRHDRTVNALVRQALWRRHSIYTKVGGLGAARARR